MESDADRLATIKALDGQLIQCDQGDFWGVFERDFVLSTDQVVESAHPVIQARTIDVADLPKDTLLKVGNEEWRIKRHEPDGAGYTHLYVKR